jgi:hypothetical protein
MSCSAHLLQLVNALIDRISVLRSIPLPQMTRLIKAKFDNWAAYKVYRREYQFSETENLWAAPTSQTLLMSYGYKTSKY